MKSKVRSAFTLVELLIVVVILAVLAATIIPQFTDSTRDAQESTTLFNLHTLRSQIQMYRGQHDGDPPSGTLVELTSQTDRDGNIAAGNPYGPYITEIPENPFNSSAAVKVITNTTPVATDVSDTHGWLYNATTGGIWISHADYFTE